eukprot:766794-Hanusia_phi.AAC.2
MRGSLYEIEGKFTVQGGDHEGWDGQGRSTVNWGTCKRETRGSNRGQGGGPVGLRFEKFRWKGVGLYQAV